MISERFLDSYGTTIVERLNDRHEHVQLLFHFPDHPRPFSYGFALQDFLAFAEQTANVAAQVRADRGVS